MRKKVNVIIMGLILILTHSVFSQNITEPPYILSVKHIPQNPKENQLIKFTAKVKPFSKASSKLKVYLFYSSDNGKNYENIEMQNKNNICTVTLNGFKKNTEIIYSVKVLDENGLSSVQIPVINNISNTDFKPDNLPIFSPPVIDEDTENNLPPELNINEFALGYGESEDKKLLYGVLKVKGEIEKKIPYYAENINSFFILLQNPDIEETENDFSYFNYTDEPTFVIPANKWIGILRTPNFSLPYGYGEDLSLKDTCFGLDTNTKETKETIPKEKSFLECIETNNSIYWFINYLLLGNIPSKSILFSVYSGYSKVKCATGNTVNNCGKLLDHTPLTRFYLPSKNQIIKITE